MSVKFIVNGEYVTPGGREGRALQAQFNELNAHRIAAETQGLGSMINLAQSSGFITANSSQQAVNEQIDLMYREVDNTPLMERKPAGHLALLGRLMGGATSVNIGKKVVKSRRVGEAGKTGVSMSGQTGITIDHTTSDYQGCVIPVFDAGYGIDWRDYEAGRSEGFDQLSEDSVEIEDNIMTKVSSFLWNGDSSIKFDGIGWLGVKSGSQSGVATHTLAADLSASTTSATDIVNELIAAIDVLRINNRLAGDLSLAVSPQIMSNWKRISSTADSLFGNILNTVRQFLPELTEVYEDANLAGNQILIYKAGMDGLSMKSGMALSTYALPRFKHNDPYDFVKWCAFGFIAKQTYSGYKSVLYASS